LGSPRKTWNPLPPTDQLWGKKDDHLEVAAKKGESNFLLSPKILAMDQRSPFQDEISADISSTSAQHANALSGAGADAQRAGLKSQEPGR